MAINITDGFNVFRGTPGPTSSDSVPIDYRMTAANSAARSSILYKYDGLKVFQLDNRLTYVWNANTNSWDVEGSGSLSGTGSINYVPKVVGTNTYGDSNIFSFGSNVGINTSTPTDSLHVIGNIRTSANFIGNGSSITNLNASNIISGSLDLARITSGVNGQILVRGVSNAQFVDSSTITVGNSNNILVNNNSTNSVFSFLFSNTTGLPSQKQIFNNVVNSIRINPSNGNIGIGTNPLTNSKLIISGNANITNGLVVGSNTVLSGGSNRTWINCSPVFGSDTYDTAGFQIGSQRQFEFFTYNSGGQIFSVYNPVAGSASRVKIENWDTYSVFTVRNQHYINTISNTGVIEFGNGGQNGQFIMYMSGGNIPSVGSPGFWIKRSIRIGETSTSNRFLFESSYTSNDCFIIRNVNTGSNAGGLRIETSSTNINSYSFHVITGGGDRFLIRGNGDTRIYGRLGIGTDPLASYSIVTNSWARFNQRLEVINIVTAGGSPNLFIDNNGLISKVTSTSSLRYKKEIKDIDNNSLNKILNMRPITYKEKDKDTNKEYYGLIAEELYEIDPKLVDLIEIDGELLPDSVQYDRLTILLIDAIKELKREIDELKGS